MLSRVGCQPPPLPGVVVVVALAEALVEALATPMLIPLLFVGVDCGFLDDLSGIFDGKMLTGGDDEDVADGDSDGDGNDDNGNDNNGNNDRYKPH